MEDHDGQHDCYGRLWDGAQNLLYGECPYRRGARQERERIARWLQMNLDVWDDDGTVASTIVRDCYTKALNVVTFDHPLGKQEKE